VTKFPIEIPGERYFEKLISCREACPVHTDARGYVQAVAQGDYEFAYRIARGPNPFASICGLVCGAPCEKACRRGAIDEPVFIRALKRTTTERHGPETGASPEETLALSIAPGSVNPTPLKHKVAIVGAGVGGLSAAHDLARLGYQVTVFEAAEKPGGMLRTGVPVFRLPVKIWEKEIEAILALGVELQCGVSVGKDVTLQELHDQGYEAVILATGLQVSRNLELPGKELPGILKGLDFLRDYNEGKEFEALGRVIVIGGGNVAYDCARSVVRLVGTTACTLLCLESREEMPADEIEIIEGDEEHVVRANRRGPVRFVGEKKRLTGLETRAVSRVFDDNGRFNPEFLDNSEKIIPCDTIIVAIGQTTDTGFCTGMSDLELARGGLVVADRDTGATGIPWIFAVGDVSLGPGLFIDAVAHGERAAKAVNQFILGDKAAEVATPVRSFQEEPIRHQIRPDYLDLQRHHPPAVSPEERVKSRSTQVEQIFPDQEARDQGARCLRCEVETVFDGSKCILCGGCADVCPTWCLRLVSTEEIGIADQTTAPSAIIKDEERCIRCGYCAERCPTDAITMERVCGYETWTVPGSTSIRTSTRKEKP
jgi:NADPH-dependent glutamate synthase beta subunit-like oxidoreductase